MSTVALAVALLALAPPPASLAANAPPKISSFSPTSGPVGTLVTIKGKNFGSPAPGLQVSFNGTLAAPEIVVPNKITVRVPALATTGRIQVKTRYGTAVTGSAFRVTRGIASFPRGAWAGQQITAAGSGFPPNHDITLKLDGASFGGVATDANGNFSLLRTLPATISVGPNHILLALDTITHVSQQIHIWIFGGWPQPRSDPEQTGDGAEFLIDTSNAIKVKQHYNLEGFTSPVVEDGGAIYVGSGANSVVQFNPWASPDPTFGWQGSTDHEVDRAPAVGNGMVYAVTDDKLYAFNEDPPTNNPELFWSANLGLNSHPYAPVFADGRVFVADGAEIRVYDANGVTNCTTTLPTICSPLWSASYNAIYGSPAIDAKSDGGTGDVYLSVENSNALNKIVVRTEAGVAAGSSPALATTSLSAPALGGGRVIVSGWSGASATATLYAVDASSLALLWSSTDLGGSSEPTGVAVGGGDAYVQDSDGILHAFKMSGCGNATCNELWQGDNYGTEGTTPPTLANGVVYVAQGVDSQFPTLRYLQAFDAKGGNCYQLNLTMICQHIAMPTTVGPDTQITVVAGTVFGPEPDALAIAEVY